MCLENCNIMLEEKDATYAQEIILKRIVEKQGCCHTDSFQFHHSDSYSDSSYSDYSDHSDYYDIS